MSEIDEFIATLAAVRQDAAELRKQIEAKAAAPAALRTLETEIRGLKQSVQSINPTGILDAAERGAKAAAGEIGAATKALREAAVGALIRRRVLLAVLGTVVFVLGALAWAGITPTLRAWGWITTPGLSPDQAALLDWAGSDEGKWAKRFATANAYIHNSGCPASAVGNEQGHPTCIVWLVQ